MLDKISQFMTVPAVQDMINNLPWSWPVLEMIHYIGLALIIGVVGGLDLRILGCFRSMPIGALRPLIPLAIIGFIGNLLGGLVFVMGSPLGATFYVTNLSFQLKLIALFIILVNLVVFRVSGLEARVYAVPAGGDAPTSAKVVAGLSLLCWVLVIIFGRLLMYNDTLMLFLGLWDPDAP
jgi:hypothetical protein